MSAGSNRSSSDATTAPPCNITTLEEAAAAFDDVATRANRCSLQIATFKAHEQQVRRYLVERVLPAADAAAKDREYVSARQEEDHSNALLRLKGVNVSPSARGASPRSLVGKRAAQAMDDHDLALSIAMLRDLSARYGNKGSQ